MAKIPQKLVDTLVELGLLESEAKIYSALTLYPGIKIKDLRELLSLSRPTIYAGLRSLDERGFIDQISIKPASYQVVPPELALEILEIMHRNSKEKALAMFRSLEQESVVNAPSSMWIFIDNDRFEAKINEMLDNARDSVFCLTSGKYLDLIEARAKTNLDFQLAIISDDHVIQERLEHVFKKYKAGIRTIKKSRIMDTVMNNFPSIQPKERIPDRDLISEKLSIFHMDSMFVLNTDDKEIFIIPPAPLDHMNGGMTTKNKSLILYQKLMMKMMINSEP
jgi:HTH-type transcriptional regulator, sugar sensing transcriptional regulator